jgi:hypothetical protein
MNSLSLLLAGLFGCKLESFPFTYLGLPLGLSRPRIRDLGPLYSRINHRLAATASFLSLDGRIMVTKAILSSLPTFYLCTFKLADGAVEIVDKSRRIGIWGKPENSNRPKSLAAWDLVCRPKSKGGLGITNLAAHNEALLLKFLHKFFNKENIPWVHLLWRCYNNSTPQATNISSSFWWRDIIKLCPKIKMIASCSISSGDIALLWSDKWSTDLLMTKFPRLHSFAIDKLASVKNIFDMDDPIDAFHLPLSTQALEEFQEFNHLINQTRSIRNANENDLWSYNWGTHFSASKIYDRNFEHIQAPIFSLWIWKSKCMPKIKSFFCLLANDRLNTKDMLLRKNFSLDDIGICSKGMQNFSKKLLELDPLLQKFFLFCIIWKQRNIFDNISPTIRA